MAGLHGPAQAEPTQLTSEAGEDKRTTESVSPHLHTKLLSAATEDKWDSYQPQGSMSEVLLHTTAHDLIDSDICEEATQSPNAWHSNTGLKGSSSAGAQGLPAACSHLCFHASYYNGY